MSWLPEPSVLSAFLVASLALALTPGPAVLYLVARGVSQGRGAALVSVAGVAAGNLANPLGAAFGLAALFAVSSAAFTVVKWAGALYLGWLGVQALRRPAARATGAPLPAVPLRRVGRDGFLVALLNPKTTLFFAAFLPQFASSPLHSVTLACVFVGVAAVTDAGYALAAGAIACRLKRVRRAADAGRWLSVGTYIGLGVFTALGGARKS